MAIDLEKLQESPHLLDILLQMEDVLDTMDIYVFKNWLKGEVVEGPFVRRYWLNMTLLYKYDEMPDPRAALRLLKHGVRVDFEEARYEDLEKEKAQIAEEADTNGFMTANEKSNEKKAEEDDADNKNKVWLVQISIPRRLVVQMAAAQHDFYDEEVDIDQVEDAKDDGMDDESGYREDEQSGVDPSMDPNAAPGGPGAAPGGPPGGGQPL